MKIFNSENSIISICFLNISSSIFLNMFHETLPCVSCLILISIFFLIFVSVLLQKFFYNNKVFFNCTSIFFSLIGIYVSMNKLLFHQEKYRVTIKSCIGNMEDLFNIQYLISFISDNIQQCHISKSYFLGLQIEYYILFSFSSIILICIKNFFEH